MNTLETLYDAGVPNLAGTSPGAEDQAGLEGSVGLEPALRMTTKTAAASGVGR